MRLRVIVPIASDVFDRDVLKEFSSLASAGTEVTVVSLDEGPQSIESECEEALAVPDFLRKANQAEEEGCDAVISDCFGDPGVRAGREAVSIPVIGPFEASMLLAAGLGQNIAIVTVLRSVFPMLRNQACIMGFHDRLVAIRSIDIPVLDLQNKERMKTALYNQLVDAITKDDAHVLILGCTGMMGVAKDLERTLHANGFEVPVVDPVAAALRLAETMVSLGLRQSRRTYMRPKTARSTGRVASS